jgi:hypothetical protein
MKKFLKNLDYLDITVWSMAISLSIMMIGTAIWFVKWLIVGEY